MHLILLLNFNTKLAVYPADETELIRLFLHVSVMWASDAGPMEGRSAAVGWKAQLLAPFL